MHLCVVLRDLNPTVWLAFDKEKRQLQLLVRVGHRPIHVESTLLVVQKRVGDLDVSLLELGDRDLLLDQLQEKLLLVTYPFANVKDFFLSLLDEGLGQSELLQGANICWEALEL